MAIGNCAIHCCHCILLLIRRRPDAATDALRQLTNNTHNALPSHQATPHRLACRSPHCLAISTPFQPPLYAAHTHHHRTTRARLVAHRNYYHPLSPPPVIVAPLTDIARSHQAQSQPHQHIRWSPFAGRCTAIGTGHRRPLQHRCSIAPPFGTICTIPQALQSSNYRQRRAPLL